MDDMQHTNIHNTNISEITYDSNINEITYDYMSKNWVKSSRFHRRGLGSLLTETLSRVCFNKGNVDLSEKTLGTNLLILEQLRGWLRKQEMHLCCFDKGASATCSLEV